MSVAEEFRTGHRALAGAFLGIALGISSLYFYSLGIFIKPLAAEFGWSRGAASLGAMVGTLATAFACLPLGRLVDRYGSVRIGLISLLFQAAGFAAMGLLIGGFWSYILFSGLLSVIAAGSSPLPFTRIVVAKFRQGRGLALGLALSGTGLGAMLIPALLEPFVAEHGWRSGYLMLAGVIVILLPLLALLLRGAEARPAAPPPDAGAERFKPNRIFWVLGAVFFAISIAVLGTVVHFVPMLTDAGFSPTSAGRTAAIIGLSAIAGRILVGLLLDRLAASLVAAGLFLLTATGLAVLAVFGVAAAVIGAAIIGLAIGAEVHLMAFLVARHFHGSLYGRVYGALYTLFLIGGAIGPALMGYLFDLSGTYRMPLFVAAALMATAALLVSCLRDHHSEATPAHA
jgi:MFS family permease